MVMMVLVKRKERTEKEWAKLFLDAGFNDYMITPVLMIYHVWKECAILFTTSSCSAQYAYTLSVCF